MALITRTAMIDDNGTGETGTVLNNDWKSELYNQIDAMSAGLGDTYGDVYKNASNVFTGNPQALTAANPFLALNDTSQAVDARTFIIQNIGGTLNLAAYNDAYTTAQSVPLTMTRAGAVTVGGTLTVSGGITDASLSANVALKNVNNNFVAQTINGALIVTSGGANITGAVTVNGSVNTVGGDINAGTDASKGNIYSTWPIYPGRQDTGWTKQNSWYLGSHVSYGLWSNTGLYLSSTLTVGGGGANITGVLRVNGDIKNTYGYVYPGTPSEQSSYYLASNTSYGLYSNTGLYLTSTLYVGNGTIYLGGSGWYWNTWPSGFYTNVSIKTAGYIYLNNQESYVFGADGNGTFANTTFQARAGHISSGYWMWPAAITNPGVIQQSWYLASHSSYGLYTNSGLYIEGDVWCNQVQARGFVFSPGFRCRTGSSGTYGGSVFNINWTGAVPLYIDATLIGNIAFGSDARIKRDFTPLVNSLEKVLQMRPGTFYYRKVAEQVDPDLHLGLLAQDVLPVAPEVVRNTGMVTPLTPDGMFQISYIEMVPMLVAAIQELEQRVATLSGGVDGHVHD